VPLKKRTTESAILSPAVRRLLLIPALLALALPAIAVARDVAAGDGTLIVKNGSAKIVIQAKGGVIGRFDEGKLIVRDPNPEDELEEVVTGAEKAKDLDDFVTVYTGKNIRFRFIGGRFKITLAKGTTGIDLSATGKGTVLMQGAGTIDDGTFSFNGEKPKPLPVLQLTEFTLGTTTIGP
jgi:hypothetical protein